MLGNICTYTQACIHSVFWLEGTWLSSMSKEDSGLKSWIITRSLWKYRSPWRKSQTLSSHLLSLPHRVLAEDFSRPAALLPTSSGSLHMNLGSHLKTSATTVPSLTSLKQFRVPRGIWGPCTSERETSSWLRESQARRSSLEAWAVEAELNPDCFPQLLSLSTDCSKVSPMALSREGPATLVVCLHRGEPPRTRDRWELSPACPLSHLLTRQMRMGNSQWEISGGRRKSARPFTPEPQLWFNGHCLPGMREPPGPRDQKTKALEEVQGGGGEWWGPALCWSTTPLSVSITARVRVTLPLGPGFSVGSVTSAVVMLMEPPQPLHRWYPHPDQLTSAPGENPSSYSLREGAVCGPRTQPKTTAPLPVWTHC